ncbi:MAG: glycerophosphodiester phosphodiesterase family protein [Clostridia bacterium]|nr:glycerophosphodiester phosphodiesterase family protein [Clostridia bacterium]
MKRILYCLFICALLCAFMAPAAAADFGDGPVCAAYRGDTALFPANSLAGIRAAVQSGAALVSVDAARTKDGGFVLLKDGALSTQCDAAGGNVCDLTLEELTALHLFNADGTPGAEPVASLEAAVDLLPEHAALILDGAWGYREDLTRWAAEHAAADKLYLRTEESAGTVAAFCQEHPDAPQIIGVYTGNVIFNADAHLTTLTQSGCRVVQYQSKNYFNVAFETLLPNRFLKHADARVMVSTFDRNRCGQRSDDILGWDALIAKGYSVIETGDPAGFAAYLAQRDAARSRLTAQLSAAEAVDRSALEATSEKNFSKALAAAQDAAADPYAALSTLQTASADLRAATADLTKQGEASNLKGSWRVTPGKLIVIVVFGALLLLGDVFVFRMRKKEETT